MFDKDGTITIDPNGYSTISTANFIAEVLGVGAKQYNNRLIMTINSRHYQADKLKLRHIKDSWNYEVVECKRDVVHNINRKLMNSLRRDTQEFRKFLSGLMKIKDYTLTEEELQEVNIKEKGQLTFNIWGYQTDDMTGRTGRFRKFGALLESEDAENWHSAAMWLCASARYSMWDKKFDPRTVVGLLDDILIALNPTVLVPRQLEAGDIKVDAYGKFKDFIKEE